MYIENATGSMDGEARRHLQTLMRRRWVLIAALCFGLLYGLYSVSEGDDTWSTSSVVRVPDPTQSSVFSSDRGETGSNNDTERIIASAIQLIRGNEVESIVSTQLGPDRAAQISLFEVSSVSDTLFVQIRVDSLDPAVALDASRTYAEAYVQEQSRLDVRDLETRATNLRSSADELDGVIERIDEDLDLIEEDLVGLEIALQQLNRTFDESNSIPAALVPTTIEQRDLDRRKTILLGERARRSEEQTFLRQEASNLDIEASYRRQTGAQIVSPPESPELVQNSSVLRNVVLFGILGAMLGVALALALEYFDSRVKDMSDLHDLAPEVPVIGAVPRMTSTLNQPHLAVSTGKPWYAAEAYRSLRTSLLAMYGSNRRSFVISSAGASAGKSVTVVNLAVSLAQSGFSTLVIDANLRRPSVHMKLGTANDAGLAQVVPSGGDPGSFIVSSPLAAGLSVLPAGPPPANPAELLGSRRMVELIEWAQSHYHYVLVDTPPLDVYTDAAVMAHHLGGLIVVVRFDATDHRRLSETLEQLETSGIPLLGFIVNGRKPSHSRAQRYARSVGVRNFRTLWTDRATKFPEGSDSGAERRVGSAYPDEKVGLEPALLSTAEMPHASSGIQSYDGGDSEPHPTLWDAAPDRIASPAYAESDTDDDDDDISALSLADRRKS